MKRKSGFYWIKRKYKSDPWVIARWQGGYWLEFMYSLPTPFKRVYRIGPYIEVPLQ